MVAPAEVYRQIVPMASSWLFFSSQSAIARGITSVFLSSHPLDSRQCSASRYYQFSPLGFEGHSHEIPAAATGVIAALQHSSTASASIYSINASSVEAKHQRLLMLQSIEWRL
jgi:hypothetical protein